MNTEQNQIIAGLLEAMESAIRIGDWKVDGRCDPDMVMAAASSYLEEQGYRRDGITGTEWLEPV